MGLFNISPRDLKRFAYRNYSQLYQDGILDQIFKQIGFTNKVAIEFGARDGRDLSNSLNLEVNHGFTRILFDGNASGPTYKEMIRPDNVEEIFKKYNTPLEPDYLSIDIDSHEFWVFQAINNYRPRIISIEYNSNFSFDKLVSIKYDPEHSWDNFSWYFGCSLAALDSLAKAKDYTAVCLVEQLDVFFIRNDLLDPKYIPPTLQELLPHPIPCHVVGQLSRGQEWIKV